MENLYTFIVDWNGGTYLSQIEGTSLINAIDSWFDEYDFAAILQIKNAREDAKTSYSSVDDIPVSIEGLVNVWCIILVINGISAIVHIILTNRELPVIQTPR